MRYRFTFLITEFPVNINEINKDKNGHRYTVRGELLEGESERGEKKRK